jgi:hypothetical protein
MTAFWCRADGSREGALVLEAVTLDGQTGGLRLRFRPAEGTTLPVQQGSTVPVLLHLDTLPESGLMPLSAIGDDGQVWFIENGKASAKKISLGSASGEMVQVPQELAGCRVVLEPESIPAEIAVRTPEGK